MTSAMSECQNCGVLLEGKYCHACGQSKHNIVKFFGEVFLDFFNDILGYDSRLKHTLLPILIFPGKLTNDYIKGRRFYYVLPFRLYLITSVFLFLFIQMSFNAEDLGSGGDAYAQIVASVNTEIESEVENEEFELELIPNNNDFPLNQDLEADIAEILVNRGSPLLGERPFKDSDEVLEDGSFKKVFVDQIEENWSDWQQDPTPLVNKFLEILPFMMLIILPIYALFYKLIYFFQKRFYVEHIVFLLHIQSFSYLVIMLGMGIYFLTQALAGYDFWLTNNINYTLNIIAKALTIWVVIYIFLAMKTVYKQSWLKTLFKFFLCSLFFTTINFIGFGLTVVISIGRA